MSHALSAPWLLWLLRLQASRKVNAATQMRDTYLTWAKDNQRRLCWLIATMTKADEGDADEDGDEVDRLSGGAGPAGGKTAKRIVDNE